MTFYLYNKYVALDDRKLLISRPIFCELPMNQRLSWLLNITTKYTIQHHWAWYMWRTTNWEHIYFLTSYSLGCPMLVLAKIFFSSKPYNGISYKCECFMSPMALLMRYKPIEILKIIILLPKLFMDVWCKLEEHW